MATEHLLSVGHTRIGFVGPKESKEAVPRYERYKHALEEHGVSVDNDLYINATFYEENTLTSLKLSQLGKVLERVTGIVCASDYLALGIIQFLGQLNIG